MNYAALSRSKVDALIERKMERQMQKWYQFSATIWWLPENILFGEPADSAEAVGLAIENDSVLQNRRGFITYGYTSLNSC